MHLGQKIKNYWAKRCQNMSGAGRSGLFASLYGPQCTRNMPCATWTFLAGETWRRSYFLQDLFVQDQAAVCLHLDFITSSPPPSPFIWESAAKKTRFPRIASSLKVSRVFNSEKNVKPCWPGAALVGDPVPQFPIHCICAITKTTNRERPH